MAKETNEKKKKQTTKVSKNSPKKRENTKTKDNVKKTNDKKIEKSSNKKNKDEKIKQLEKKENINNTESLNKEKIENVKEESEVKENHLIAVQTFLIVIGLVVGFVVLIFNFYLNNITPSNKYNIEYASDNTNTITNEKSNTLPDFNIDKSRNSIRGYLEQKFIAMSDPKVLLEQYGLATESEFAGFEKSADGKYYKTKILYEKVKDKFLPYTTQEFFKKEYKDIYISSNGLTHVAVSGTKNEKYTLLRSEQIKGGSAPVLSVWYKTTNAEGIESDEKNMKVEFTLNRGDWVISNIK